MALLHAGEDAAQWLARADVAIYLAKQQGRDRVVVHESDGASVNLPTLIGSGWVSD
ncbi:hypothetical protein [Luteimonas sp. MC1828]|uniref:hypothetical protein n=1 Tax=Luteimonas sp. MC1828 TaxID=2799787 RepID=UPI0018F142E4|nr:hypothetical protein [Luteimonas sp. MC1828]MBJ7575664.1 hypothetical protein [Luteimonas sp. MC1828]